MLTHTAYHGAFGDFFAQHADETFLGELLDAGFILEKLVEPRPIIELREVDAAAYERLMKRPSFIAVRMRRE